MSIHTKSATATDLILRKSSNWGIY